MESLYLKNIKSALTEPIVSFHIKRARVQSQNNEICNYPDTYRLQTVVSL